MKMKPKTKKRIQGSVSVLLVIIMLPMMAFSALIVDMSRINMAKQMMSSAGDLTMNTALANYDTILKDVYGLFAMSQQEGMSNEELGNELNKYFAETLTSYGVVSEEEADDYVAEIIGDFKQLLNGEPSEFTNFIELNNIELQANKVDASSLANASIMRKQVVEYMKYRAPLGVGMGFLESLTAFEKVDDQNVVVEAQVAAQESTQDVTQACKKLIEMIRAYDKRVLEINGTSPDGINGDAVKGRGNSKDGIIIPLEDYDTQVEKYLSVWGEDYTHINKLNLVFLANSPSEDGVYLKALTYPTSYYVGYDGSVYQGGDTGISVSITPAADTAGAQRNVENQIALLDNTYKPIANKYSESMLKSTLLTYNSNNIQKATISSGNEENAVKNFIQFENFLLNKSQGNNITYQETQKVFEQIGIMDLHRKDFESKIGADIQTATEEKNAAQSAYDELVGQKQSAATTMDARIRSINTTLTNYVSQYEDVDTAVSFMAGFESPNLPGIKNIVTSLPARGQTGFETYYNRNIKDGTSDKYISYFKYLINDSAFTKSTDEDIAEIIKWSQKFIDNQKNSYDTNGYDNYMRGKLNAAQERNDLFKLLTCLKTCHAYAITYKNNIGTYNQASEKIPAASQRLDDAKDALDDLVSRRDNVLSSIKRCVKQFNPLCQYYQADIYYYKYFKQAAKNTIEPEAQAIQAQFSKIVANLAELEDDLEAIGNHITQVLYPAIDAYTAKLNAWENAAGNYENKNGGDSFSDQAQADVEKSRKEYDKALYDTLDLFITALWNEYRELYLKLTEEGNFVYGSKKIKDITTAQHLIDAVFDIGLSDVVTVEEATTKLSTLYKGESLEYVPYTMDYEKQLGFLFPKVLQIQALKYLNNSYPDEANLTQTQKDSNEQTKKDYEESKNKLTGSSTTIDSNSGGSTGSAEHKNTTESEEVTADFGYSYAAKSVSGDRPSSSIARDKEDVNDDEYLLKTEGEGDNEKLDASSGLSGQTGKSNSILKGIGNTANTALENLYILNYVFENFSYNTIVQEQVLKDNKLQNDTVLLQISEANNHFGDATKVTEAKKKTTTLSNYSINEKNNYLYGAEIEYLLFGSPTAKNNVTSAKASVYAIRFAFNCIFAFTDSEIRNTTMSAGLAVQAATMGIVPYQVVQIVLQLALAAAESAIDLSAMNHGLKVAIVKTKDTWSLGLSGAKNALKDVGNAAAQMVTNELSGMVMSAIHNVSDGLSGMLAAGADEIEGAIKDLTSDMTGAAKGVLESVADSVCTSIMSEIESALNELQNTKLGKSNAQGGADVTDIQDALLTVAQAEGEVNRLFSGIEGKLDSIVSNACGGNEMALALASPLKNQAQSMLDDMKQEVLAVIPDAGEIDLTGIMSEKMNDLKRTMVDYGNTFVSDMSGFINEKAQGLVAETESTLNGYIEKYTKDAEGKAQELTEDAAEKLKQEVSDFADTFIDEKLKIDGPGSAATDVKSSPAAMFKFGYKDYLMILTYISICCGDSVLLRTADLVQMNLQKAGDGSDFKHPGGENFRMSKANTYISVTATADLDMFFMDMGIFASLLETGETAVDDSQSEEAGGGSTTEAVDEEKRGTSLTYKGLLGY